MPDNVPVERGGNRLLAAMGDDDFARLEPHLEQVSLMQHQVLQEPGQPVRRAYFPHEGFASLLTVFEDGLSVETATVGPEGAVDLPLLVHIGAAPSRVVIQAPGRAAMIAMEPLQRAINDSPALLQLLQSYVHGFLAQILQTVACNAVHTAEERLAKWLLMSADRTNADNIPLTHEFLAEMLGVGRPTVSLVAHTLQTAGLIDHRRGLITIVDRAGLEEVSCSCYRTIHRAYEELLPMTYSRSDVEVRHVG
jgi:CRP-like cAMP-binding protein